MSKNGNDWHVFASVYVEHLQDAARQFRTFKSRQSLTMYGIKGAGDHYQDHIRRINDTIDSLRAAKVALEMAEREREKLCRGQESDE